MRLILDHDLAALYGVTTKVLMQAVRRNLDRFPQDFLLTLENHEVANLRSQIVTSSLRWGGRRYSTNAFTEHGAIMAATVLRSSRRQSPFKVIWQSASTSLKSGLPSD